MADLTDLSLTEIISGLQAGEFSSRELTQELLQRTERLDPALHAYLTLTPELARAVNLPANARGVIITSVDPNGDAAEEGLQRGDLIVSVNNQLVTSPAQDQYGSVTISVIPANRIRR